MRRSPSRLLAAASAAAAVLACAACETGPSQPACYTLRLDEGPGRPTPPSVEPSDCTALELDEASTTYAAPAFGIEPGAYVRFTPDIEEVCDGAVDRLGLLFPDGVPRSGSYALGEGLDRDPARCSRCVVVQTGTTAGLYHHLYLATSGALELEVTDASAGAYRAVLRDVVLQRMKRTGTRTLDVEGWAKGKHCLHVAEAVLDTRPTPRPCGSLADCPNQLAQACDPRTQSCSTEARCGADAPCPDGEVCRTQTATFDTGACHGSCDPNAPSPCPTGFHCLALEPDGSRGACAPAGDAAVGARCDPTQIASGCGAGAACRLGAPSLCHATCDFFGDGPRCPEGTRCILDVQAFDPGRCPGCHRGGLCVGPEAVGVVDEADFGEQCGDRSWRCALQDGVPRGFCVNLIPGEEEPLVCRRICRVGAGECGDGLSCAPWPSEDGDLGWCE